MFALSGCGGGGGGDGGGASASSGGGGTGSGTGSTTGVVAITSSNAPKVANVALQSAFDSDLLGVASIVIAVETTVAARPPSALGAMRTVARKAKAAWSAPQSVLGVITTQDCVVSGSVTINEDTNLPTMTVTANACSDIAGEAFSGTMSLTHINADEESQSFSATVSVDITFTQTGSAPVRINGGYFFRDVCNPPSSTSCTTTFSGAGLTTFQGTETMTLTGFTLVEFCTTSCSLTANYTVTNSVLNGSVTVATSTPIVTVIGAAHPQSGVVEITGLNSQARATILSSSDAASAAVRVEADADNNGSYEFSNTYSWPQLEAA